MSRGGCGVPEQNKKFCREFMVLYIIPHSESAQITICTNTNQNKSQSPLITIRTYHNQHKSRSAQITISTNHNQYKSQSPQITISTNQHKSQSQQITISPIRTNHNQNKSAQIKNISVNIVKRKPCKNRPKHLLLLSL